jgi:GTP-binding protein HflX
VIALVGYTNAGKSTLFNRLTRADVRAENLLFATLDPTMREVPLPGFDKAILSDTVGFISELPTQLVAAFRATLEEVISADLIIHVRDVAHPDSEAQREDVEAVLAEIGLGGEGASPPPMIEAWNKIDLLPPDERARILAEAERKEDVAPLSALTGEGVGRLLDRVAGKLRAGSSLRTIRLPASDGEAIAWLHANGEVVGQRTEGLETEIEVRITDTGWARFLNHHRHEAAGTGQDAR